MKKLILIGGVLASGKSTYSQIIKEKYHLNVINKDNLKEILGDNIYAKNREENKVLSLISFQLMMYLLENNQNTIVLESNFKPNEMAIIKKNCEKLNYQVLSLVFDATDQILHQRFLKRLNQSRHYVHKSQDFTQIEDFKKTLDELRKVQYFGKIIKVNCDDFKYQKDESLFLQIETFIN